MKPHVLCIFGSRGVPPARREMINEGLRLLAIELADIKYVLHGAAPGADLLGAEWAAGKSLPIVARPAKWSLLTGPEVLVRQGKHGPYNARAGPARNEVMATEATHFIGLRLPGKSDGTDDMVRRIQQKGKPLALLHV